MRNQSKWLGSLRSDMNPKGYQPAGNRPRSFLSKSKPLPQPQAPTPELGQFTVTDVRGPSQAEQEAAAETIQASWRNSRSHNVEQSTGLTEEEALAVGEQNNYNAPEAVAMDFSREFVPEPEAPPAPPLPAYSCRGMGWRGAAGGWHQEAPGREQLSLYRSWRPYPGFGFRYHSWYPHSYGSGARLPPNTTRMDSCWELSARRYEQQVAFEELLMEQGLLAEDQYE